jgi:hypothetical protein
LVLHNVGIAHRLYCTLLALPIADIAHRVGIAHRCDVAHRWYCPSLVLPMAGIARR